MKAIFAAASVLSLASCASIAPPAPSGSVDHVVLFWLKRPGNPDDRMAMLAACQELRAIPGIRSLDAGTALASSRPVVDDSFDIGLTVRLESADALHAYEKDPRHLKQLDTVLRPLAAKTVVYDIVR